MVTGEAVTREEELAWAAEWQSGYCTELGAPTWAAVIDAVAEELAGTDRQAPSRLLLDDDGPVTGTMVWLRFLGAVHRLVLDDLSCEPARWFRTAGGVSDPHSAVPTVLAFVESHEADIRREMAEPVQTNEVARSVPLSAAMGWLGGVLHLREVGASAGLNLWPDRVRVTGDGFAWGPSDSPLVFDRSFVSGTPEVGPFHVASRAGCDRTPRDASDPADRRVLRSFVWPDHDDRLARLDAAMSVAGRVDLATRDLVDWVHDELRDLPSGRTVVDHSIVTMYLDVHAQRAFARELGAAGARADDAHRLAHVSFELGDHDAELLVWRWPERDAHRLATMSPHGGDIRWSVEAVPFDAV